MQFEGDINPGDWLLNTVAISRLNDLWRPKSRRVHLCSSSSSPLTPPESITLPFCVCLWKVTQATASPAKSLASVSGPDQTRWRRFPICPYAQTSFWTCCKTHTGCRWTACTGRSGCTRRRARPGTAWRPATARPPRLSRCWRAAPRADSPETPTSQRPVLEHTTLPSAESAAHVTARIRRHPALLLRLQRELWGELPARARRCGRCVSRRCSSSGVSAVQECAPLKSPWLQQRLRSFSRKHTLSSSRPAPLMTRRALNRQLMTVFNV